MDSNETLDHEAIAAETPAPADDGWTWALVEIMGHRSHAGRTREEEKFGTKMIRIDVPIYTGRDANEGKWPTKIVDLAFVRWETHYYSGPSLFSFTPSDEASVRKIAERNAVVDPPAISRLADQRGHDADSTYDDGGKE